MDGQSLPCQSAGATKDDNLDMFVEPYTACTLDPPMVVSAKYSTFQLCKLQNEAMEYITEGISETGDPPICKGGLSSIHCYLSLASLCRPVSS